MNTQTIIEIVGYIGSALVLVSFLMTSVVKLRIVNTIGSFIFMIYALIIKSYPTAIMNLCLVIINLRYLWKMTHNKRVYELVRVKSDDGFLRYLLERYKTDIQACFPGVNPDSIEADCGFITNCEGMPVGILLGDLHDGVLNIDLDYSTPEYRDFSIGQFLMGHLREEGIRKLIYTGPVENHLTYLEKTGFRKEGDHYIKDLV